MRLIASKPKYQVARRVCSSSSSSDSNRTKDRRDQQGKRIDLKMDCFKEFERADSLVTLHQPSRLRYSKICQCMKFLT